jgi:endonuclease YncB( thermonuclease family)
MGGADHLGQPVIRRFLRRLVLPTVLICLLLLGLFTAMDYFAALEPPRRPAAEPEPEEPVGTETVTARPVQPALFGQPFTANDGTLTRLKPRAPLSQPPPPPEPEQPLLHRPLALSAGTLSFGGRDLVLEGITPTPADLFCTGADGADWPCGMVARTAFRNFLRGRALNCDVETTEWEGTAVTTCLMGDTDVAAWLVENGWAEPEPGSSYAALAKDARDGARGLYGPDPR